MKIKVPENNSYPANKMSDGGGCRSDSGVDYGAEIGFFPQRTKNAGNL